MCLEMARRRRVGRLIFSYLRFEELLGSSHSFCTFLDNASWIEAEVDRILYHLLFMSFTFFRYEYIRLILFCYGCGQGLDQGSLVFL